MTSKKQEHHINLPMFLLTIFVIIITAIFCIKYCSLFDEFGLFAKRRLIDYPLITFVITPVFFWISAFLCRQYSIYASGNHLSQALRELKKHPNDFSKVSDFLNIRLVMIKAVSSLIACFGGGSLGKEGPSVHMSSGIFAALATKYKKSLPKINLETWVFAGTATGLAIAFNAPIAGIVFVIEKLAKSKFRDFKNNIIWTLITVSIITIIFHRPEPLFNFHNLNFAPRTESLLLIFTALICGLLAFIFQTSCNHFYLKTSSVESSWWHLTPIVGGLLVAYINFYCGIYSFSGGIHTSQEALLNPEPILSYKEVGGRILNTIITFASGCAGGLIAPAMAIGTGIGSIISNLMPGVDVGIFLLIGMSAFLGSILGEPLTVAIVVFETTGQDARNIPFFLGAAIISLTTTKGLGRLKNKFK